ncbi:MAG TPA: hypothetical protein VEU30_16475 [Thermoanaerobaculia bacterium]|nr:hypothetical protein [Thermoanaerobaculia bacterium]
MEHTDARTTNAAERYLLQEMHDPERDAFEDHYFDCSECAADVRDGAAMMAAGRQIAAEGATVHQISGWRRRWLPQAAAASMIFGLLGFGAGTMRMAAPAISEIRTYELQTETERASAADVLVIPAGEDAMISFPITPAEAARSYVVTIQDADGKTRFSKPKSLDEAIDHVYLSLRELPRGSYQLVIEGVHEDGNRFHVTTTSFKVGER